MFDNARNGRIDVIAPKVDRPVVGLDRGVFQRYRDELLNESADITGKP
jgi:hypothetical protein